MFDLLAKKYYSKRVMLGNIANWINTILILELLLHCLTCSSLFVHNEGLTKEDLTFQYMFISYWEEFYFMTTTFTTVGYGDLSAEAAKDSMGFIILVQFFGLLAFSMIMNSVLEYDKIETVQEAIAKRKQIAKDFLDDIVYILPKKELDDAVYELAYKSIHTTEMYSTRKAFSQNKFFRALSPKLKHKFV